MNQSVSKSRFKAKALEYFREVERSGKSLVITDHGAPVLQIVPYRVDPEAALRVLRESVIGYGDLLAPLDEEWNSEK